MAKKTKKSQTKVDLPAELKERAKKVLAENYRHGHTIPAEGLYPHQWLWDSCFIAIGVAHYDVERAQKEILNLLKGQWSNGMVPHMIFDMGFRYRQDRELWRSYSSPYSPDDIATSGITQPPMIAEAVVRIGKHLNKHARRAWYLKTYPKLVAYHKWLYRDRDPKNEGLVLLVHPWETGLDSTPPWMSELTTRHMAWWIRAIKSLGLEPMVNKLRRDTKFVPPGQRTSTTEALLIFNLLRKLRHKSFSNTKILKSRLPKIEDVGYNAIFIRANTHLKHIAKTLGRDLPQSLSKDIAHTEKAFEELWDEAASQYFNFNINTGEPIQISSISTFLALYSGKISKDHAARLVKQLGDKQTYATNFKIPSAPANSEWFAPHRYWQGPVWINTNWLIADGLERYGYKKEAAEIRETSLRLVEKSGFYEYFSPMDGSPAGAKNFSWTASLTIDFLDQTS